MHGYLFVMFNDHEAPLNGKQLILRDHVTSVFINPWRAKLQIRCESFNPFIAKDCQGRVNSFWALKWQNYLKSQNIKAFPRVLGQNKCVHHVLRSILSQKRPGRLRRNVATKFGIFDFLSAIFWSILDGLALSCLIPSTPTLPNF